MGGKHLDDEAGHAVGLEHEELGHSGQAESVVKKEAGRYLRDAKLYEIGAGTSEIRRMLIGRQLFDKTR